MINVIDVLNAYKAAHPKERGEALKEEAEKNKKAGIEAE